MIKAELTPPHLKCFHGTCPAVYELDDGRLLVVAEHIGPVAAEELGLPATKVDWGTEGVFRIDRALLANVDPFPSNLTAPGPYEPIDENYRKPDVWDV